MLQLGYPVSQLVDKYLGLYIFLCVTKCVRAKTISLFNQLVDNCLLIASVSPSV